MVRNFCKILFPDVPIKSSLFSAAVITRLPPNFRSLQIMAMPVRPPCCRKCKHLKLVFKTPLIFNVSSTRHHYYRDNYANETVASYRGTLHPPLVLPRGLLCTRDENVFSKYSVFGARLTCEMRPAGTKPPFVMSEQYFKYVRGNIRVVCNVSNGSNMGLSKIAVYESMHCMPLTGYFEYLQTI